MPSVDATNGNSAINASVDTTWERPKQVSWRNVPVVHRLENGKLLTNGIRQRVNDAAARRRDHTNCIPTKSMSRLDGSGTAALAVAPAQLGRPKCVRQVLYWAGPLVPPVRSLGKMFVVP